MQDADKELIARIKAMGRLVDNGAIMHSYPFCWRSDTPLIYKVCTPACWILLGWVLVV